jgi:hypothetical protein
MVISSSSGENGDAVAANVISFAEIVHPYDTEKFIHIPSASAHAVAKKIMDGLHASLASLGVSVSTGRVVDFRLKDALRLQSEKGTVPLVHPCHFNGGTVHWPKLAGRKPNAILNNDETRPWLVRSGVYLLTKRFTSKAVTSAGPVDGKRRKELKELFAGCKAGLVFVTAFETRRAMQSFLSYIAWESEVWIAEDPDHMIHFNGERFLGPYPDVTPE